MSVNGEHAVWPEPFLQVQEGIFRAMHKGSGGWFGLWSGCFFHQASTAKRSGADTSKIFDDGDLHKHFYTPDLYLDVVADLH